MYVMFIFSATDTIFKISKVASWVGLVPRLAIVYFCFWET